MSQILRKAQRQKAKIRVGMSGPAGSGKTYSSLLMAKGIVSSMDKVAIIDTENGSADLYSNLGDFNVFPLQAPYNPERYIEAIDECIKAGMELVIIDSASHEWDGKGGCLEINDLIAKTRFKGNTWAAWSDTTPRHQSFIEAITTAPVHIITCARSKTDMIQTDDKKIKKVGMKEIQREGFEYEPTINFTLDRDGHYATASKDRTGIFIDKDPFVINEEVGKVLKQWSEEGIDPLPSAEELKKKEEEERIKKQQILKIKKGIMDNMAKLGYVITPENIVDAVKVATKLKLVEENYEEISNRLTIMVQEKAEAGAISSEEESSNKLTA